MRIDIRFDQKAIALSLEQARRDVIVPATVRALNRTATGVRTDAVREIRALLPLPAKSIRARLKIRKATRTFLETTISAPRDYDPSLALFKPKWRPGQPVGAAVTIGNRRVTVPGAFVRATPYKKAGVFRRVGTARKPLAWLRASDAGVPTLQSAFIERIAAGVLERQARARFSKELQRELQFRGG